MDDVKLNAEETADYLGVKISTLQHWREDNKGPKFYKPSGKLVFYFKSDLDAWIKGDVRVHTLEESMKRGEK